MDDDNAVTAPYVMSEEEALAFCKAFVWDYLHGALARAQRFVRERGTLGNMGAEASVAFLTEQYRSAIFPMAEDPEAACQELQAALTKAGHDPAPMPPFHKDPE